MMKDHIKVISTEKFDHCIDNLTEDRPI